MGCFGSVVSVLGDLTRNRSATTKHIISTDVRRAQGRSLGRSCKHTNHTLGFQVPLMKKEIAKARQPLPQDIHESVAKRIFNDLVPLFKKELVEVRQGLFQEHSQDLAVEQMVSSFSGRKAVLPLL